jgi:hypothetical protein
MRGNLLRLWRVNIRSRVELQSLGSFDGLVAYNSSASIVISTNSSIERCGRTVHRSVNFSSMRRLRQKASSVLPGSIG